MEKPEKQLNPQQEEDSASSIDISSFHIEQTTVSRQQYNSFLTKKRKFNPYYCHQETEQTSQNSHKTSVQTNTEDSHEEGDVQAMAHGITAPEESGNEVFSTHQLNGMTKKTHCAILFILDSNKQNI